MKKFMAVGTGPTDVVSGIQIEAAANGLVVRLTRTDGCVQTWLTDDKDELLGIVSNVLHIPSGDLDEFLKRPETISCS